MDFNYIFTIIILLNFFTSICDCALLPNGIKKHSKDTMNFPKLNQSWFTQNIETKLSSAVPENDTDPQFHLKLPHALKRLAELDKLILQTTHKFHDQKQILSALEVLLNLKITQIESDSQISQNIIRHLDQISKALQLMTRTNWDDDPQSLKITRTQIFPRDLNPKTATEESHPGLKKILSTGGFVFLIFSTASDVCTVTGGAFCVFVYLAGAGGIGIWLNSIYKIALGIN